MTMKFIRQKLLIAAGLVALTACSPTVAQHGNILEDQQIAKIIPGVHTRSDVLRILGSPTTQAPFNENVWYYIGQETEKHGILDPEVTQEKIIVVAFDENETVKAINNADQGRLDIPYARSKTPTHGNEMTVMQQLLGNLGRFNPQDKGSATSTGGGKGDGL
jgi:outer membrane protein assembly factor BamE (lipoprotein component of BamABCDE complex)